MIYCWKKSEAMERETYQALCVAGHSVWASRYGSWKIFPDDFLGAKSSSFGLPVL